MLSTSILYCNKLDDTLLETIDNASASITGNESKFNSSLPLSLSEQRGPKSVNPSAISEFSEHTSSVLCGNRSRYRVRYLGCNTCDPRTHRLDNGIAAYQKPLLDLYSTVLRRSVVLRSLSVINQVADFSSHGIVIAERDRFSPSKHAQLPVPARPHSSVSSTSGQKASVETVVTKVITPLSNIVLWAAVKFQHRSSMKKVKNSSVKRRQIGVAFVPLSCSEAVLDKNAFVSLTSKQRFLLGLPHPPLFACVLQKVNSNQRLECHLFVCLTTDDAIRMCNRMSELRQRASNIGKLQVPLPGQMGSYSYRSTPQPSSAASLVSRSSNYAFSDLSSFTPKHHFSDIEEEDASRQFDEQMDSLDSNTTSTTRNFTPHPINGRLAYDPRFDRARKLNQVRRPNQVTSSDSLSWTELSSISSAIISTKSESNKSRLGSHAAQRDYRFQSYKCPENFVLPELANQSEKNKLVCDSITTAKKSFVETSIIADKCTNKWSSVSEELQNNRLFAKASAKASFLESDEVTPSSEQKSKNVIDEKIRVNRVATENGLNSAQRFFGDTLRGVQCVKTSETNKPNARLIDKGPRVTSDQPKTNLSSKEFNRNSSADNSIRDALKVKQERPLERFKQQNEILKSTISSSIFFDNEDEGLKDYRHLRQGPSSHNKSAFVSQDSLGHRDPVQRQIAKNVIPKTKSEPDMVGNSRQRNRQRSDKGDAVVVLYLPENSNVGVKCFNKSTSVNKWSTMVSSNISSHSKDNECEFCSLELNCEECCNLCQSIEHQKRQSCPDCVLDHDDIVLDESILQNFTKSRSIADKDKTHATTLSANQNGNSYLNEIQMSNVPQLEAKISKSDCRKTTLLSRIRQFGSSIFGSRKALNRSRIWSRLRTNSQKLKGSKRFAKNKTFPKEPVNRIFLPVPNKLTGNNDTDKCRLYAEPYLNQPDDRNVLRMSSDNVETCEHLSTAIENVNLNSDRVVKKERERPSKPNNVPRTKTNKAEDKQKIYSEQGLHRNSIKPFFISNPYKAHEGLHVQVEGDKSESSPNQVLSMSSDSGMEEYDCHSSTENSPSGYPQVPNQPNGFDYDRTKALMTRSNALYYSKTKMPSSRDLANSPNYNYRRDTGKLAKLTSPFSHKQTGHWSETNIESELGYMP